jgi:hypothetical protein
MCGETRINFVLKQEEDDESDVCVYRGDDTTHTTRLMHERQKVKFIYSKQLRNHPPPGTAQQWSALINE